MSLYEFVERPDLESPVLILALDGWIDAGLGAANARAALLASLDPVTVATFDSDQLLDHRARRPTMHLVDGVVTGLTWPSVELQAGRAREVHVDFTGFRIADRFVVGYGLDVDERWRNLPDVRTMEGM